MKRREFITLLGGTMASWPLVARAQQDLKLPTIGFLGAATPGAWKEWVAAFVGRLHELNWVEGRTVAIVYRWAEGRNERFAEIAAEFVRLNVDVIITAGTAPVVAAMQATSVIPIVFATAGNPVGTGLVKSLARPGGNVTGLSNQAFDTAAKRLEILSEAIPGLRELAILVNTGSPIGVLEMGEVQAAARKIGVRVGTFEIRRSEDILPDAFGSLKDRSQALYVLYEPLVASHLVEINAFALSAHLPTMHNIREGVETGGLVSYGPNFPAQYRRAADYVDRILHGTKPGEIPVEQPTKFDLVVNLTTAKAIGLTIPATVLARADDVIE
jgi:putative tryptophan/tyrosine transport system substrate-binding protein